MPHLIDTMQSAFWFIVTISIIVFIHEYGHFFFARLYGVKVETFSIVFGKELFGFNDKLGTRWKICLVPLGGYIKMFGDADPASSTTTTSIELLSDADKQQTFHYKPVWQKSIIVAAGPLANFLLAIFILLSVYTLYGRNTIPAEVGQITVNSPADKAGLEVNDIIIKVDGDHVTDYQQLFSVIAYGDCKPINLTLLRGEDKKEIVVTPELISQQYGNQKVEMPFIGFEPKRMLINKLNLLTALTYAVTDTYNISSEMIKAISQMLTGKNVALGGPFQIAKHSRESIKVGYIQFFKFIAILSINLGLVNLFPIPLLDGGHLVFYGIEKIKRKPLSIAFKTITSRIGIALLGTLMLFAILNDLKSLFS